MTFRDAAARDYPMTIALAGAGGSGKTYTALVLATAMKGDGPICMIDTEDGRGERYFKHFDYKYDELTKPFSPGRYIDKMQDAVDFGAGALIVDSCSHEWEGEGGCLEEHFKVTGGDDKKNANGWAKVKPAHRKFIEFAKRAKIPTVFCFRAREKSKPVPGKGFVSLGWQPITNDETSFEFVLTAMLEPEGAGTLMKVKTFLDFENVWKPGLKITPQIAQKLVQAHRKSCMGDGKAKPCAPIQDAPACAPDGDPLAGLDDHLPPTDFEVWLGRDQIELHEDIQDATRAMVRRMKAVPVEDRPAFLTSNPWACDLEPKTQQYLSQVASGEVN